MIAPASTSIF